MAEHAYDRSKIGKVGVQPTASRERPLSDAHFEHATGRCGPSGANNGRCPQRGNFATHWNCRPVLHVAVDPGIEIFCVNPSVRRPPGLMAAVYSPAPPDVHDMVIARWLSRTVPTSGAGPLPLSAVPANSSLVCRTMTVI